MFKKRYHLNLFIIGQLICLAAFFFSSSLLLARDVDSVYEITAHRAEIHIFPSSSELRCVDTLTLRLTKTAESITLTFLPIYKIERITVNEEEVEYERVNSLLRITDFPQDTILDLLIKYSGKFELRSSYSSITSEGAVIRDVEIFPTGPKRLELIRLSITVPDAWETIAVGKLQSVQSFADSSTFVWELNQPVPEIGWICAGRFWRKGILYGDVPITLHLFPEDSNSVSDVTALASDILSFYSDKFSPYRFPKLDIVEVEDWIAGGNVLAIASPSLIMVKKRAFTTSDTFNRIESILAHEIAHQWWPLTVFIDEQDVAFMAEGMCEYSSILFNEKHGTKSRRDSLNRHPLLRPLMVKIQQGQDAPLQQRVDLRTMVTQYLKASYVHHMLRGTISDSVFWNLYREYALRFSLKTASLSDFRSLAERISGLKLDWFFEQWVQKRGVPYIRIYNVKSKPHNAGWITQGRVRIVGYEKFTISGFVIASTSVRDEKCEFKLGYGQDGNYRNDVPFQFVTKERPRRILLDPDGDLLKVQKLPPKLSDLREPSSGIMIVGTKQHHDVLRESAEKDSAILERAGWSISMKHDTSVTLNDFQNERVFIYGKGSENHAAAELENKFPVRFQNDTLLFESVKMYDSTLTLFEIVDNPFMSHGLMMWIAPFSERAVSELLPYDRSWIVVRGKDEITSGTWEVVDEDLVVEIK